MGVVDTQMVRDASAGVRRNSLGGPLFGPNNPSPISGSAIRSDPRILKHYRDKTYKLIQKLYEMAMNESLPPGIQLQAISEYLTRAMGKPVQAIDLNLEDRRPIVIDGALSKLAELVQAPESVGLGKNT